MSKLILRLAEKIEHDLGIKVDPETFVSNRPKPAHKLAGAWSWEMRTVQPVNGVFRVGSIYTATECAKKNVVLVRVDATPWDWPQDAEIIPEEK